MQHKEKTLSSSVGDLVFPVEESGRANYLGTHICLRTRTLLELQRDGGNSPFHADL